MTRRCARCGAANCNVICFGIDYLDLQSLSRLDFCPRRAIGVSQQKLNCAQLLVNVNIGVFIRSCADASQFLDQLVLLHLSAGQLCDRVSLLGTPTWIPTVSFSPSRHWSSPHQFGRVGTERCRPTPCLDRAPTPSGIVVVTFAFHLLSGSRNSVCSHCSQFPLFLLKCLYAYTPRILAYLYRYSCEK